jgi:hypothetical protein
MTGYVSVNASCGGVAVRYLRWSYPPTGDDEVIAGAHPLDGLSNLLFLVRDDFNTFKILPVSQSRPP